MNAPETRTVLELPAITAIAELMQAHAKALADLNALNHAMMHAVGEALTAWQLLANAWPGPGVAAPRGAEDLSRLAAEYPARLSDICSRSASVWTSACVQQARQWAEVAARIAAAGAKRAQ